MTIGQKLKQILENNKHNSLVLVGESASSFTDAYVLSANVDERELHVPNWKNELVGKSYLLIDGLDAVSFEVQERFVSLIKDKRAGSFKLPTEVQIIIPVASREKLSDKIQSLTIVWGA